jgi:hypothetical protein
MADNPGSELTLTVIIVPIIGTFFIKNQTGIYPPADRSESS